MVANHSNDFQRYLESVGTAYKDWWSLYTLTDAVGKQQVEREKPFSVFDFGLMVQRVKPEQPERGEAPEKTERLPVLEGLQKYASDHVLLVGRPGSGKSTALARLLLEEATKPLPEAEKGVKSPPSLVGKGVGGLGQIPVLVELRQYKTSVLDLIREFLMRHRLRLDSKEIETLLFEGRFLLLIDSLNELPSEEARRDLKAFRQNYAATSMIFTTRDLGVGGDLGIEKKLEMQPLTEAQMQDFVRAYLLEQGDLMLRQLRNRLREMGQTPLLLWMLCELFRQTGNIPPNLGLVFRCFAQSYDRKIKGDVPVSQEFRRWLPESLQQLALVMMQGETLTELRVTISRREAEAVLTTFLQGKVAYPPSRAKEWLEDLLEHHLIQLDSSHQIEFRHQLLQEYYAAESLLQRLPQISDDRLKQDYLNYLKWTEPLALMLALVDDEAEAIRVVRLALAVDLQLGARLAGEVQLKFQEKIVGLVIALDVPQLLKVQFLGITRSDCVIVILRQALNHEDNSVRWRAVEALGKIGNPEAVAVLRQALNHEDSSVRRRAASALGYVRTPQAMPTLIPALNDEDSLVRWRTPEALGNIDTPEAVAALIAALNHEDSSVRWRAASSLGKIGTPEAVAALIPALNHEDSSVRWRAAEALGKIGTPEAVAALIPALNHEDSSVRWRTAEALGKIGIPEAVAALIPALNHEDSSVRWRAASSLGKIGNPEAVAVLIQALNHENSSVRGKAADMLGNIGAPEAVAVLIQALNDEDSSVRGSAADALGNIGAPEADAALIQALSDENSWVRGSAADALGNIGNPQVVTVLIQALNDESSWVRERAADALGNIASSELLSRVWELRRTDAAGYTSVIIAKIQARCKFYNHEIFHYPLPEEKPNVDPLSHTLNTLNRTLKTMSETPKVQMTFQDKVYGAAGNVEGDMIVNASAQNLAEVAGEIQQLLDQLEQTNQTTTEAQLIVDQAVERQPLLQNSQIVEQAIKNTPPLKVRLRSAGKAAYLETVKVLLPPVGIAIEAVKAWKEPEEQTS
jgi:HEAT repeat protein